MAWLSSFMFEAPGSFVESSVLPAPRWTGAGSTADKMIRAYTLGNKLIDRRIPGASTPSVTPFVADSPGGLPTATSGADCCLEKSAPEFGDGLQEVHQLLSAMTVSRAVCAKPLTRRNERGDEI